MYNTANVFLHSLSKKRESFEPKIVSSSTRFRRRGKRCESWKPKQTASPFTAPRFPLASSLSFIFLIYWLVHSFFLLTPPFPPFFWLTNLRSLGAKLTVSPFLLADVLVKEPQISKFWQPKNSLFYPLFSFSPTLLSSFFSPFPSFYFYFFLAPCFFLARNPDPEIYRNSSPALRTPHLSIFATCT